MSAGVRRAHVTLRIAPGVVEYAKGEAARESERLGVTVRWSQVLREFVRLGVGAWQEGKR